MPFLFSFTIASFIAHNALFIRTYLGASGKARGCIKPVATHTASRHSLPYCTARPTAQGGSKQGQKPPQRKARSQQSPAAPSLLAAAPIDPIRAVVGAATAAGGALTALLGLRPSVPIRVAMLAGPLAAMWIAAVPLSTVRAASPLPILWRGLLLGSAICSQRPRKLHSASQRHVQTAQLMLADFRVHQFAEPRASQSRIEQG